MPVYVDEFESEVTFTDDQSQMNPTQFEALVERIVQRLQQVQRDENDIEEATQIRTNARTTASNER